MTWIRRNVVVMLLFLIGFGISGGLAYEQYQLAQFQHASRCWDQVLTVAVHDHLTPAQRAALIHHANGCANETGN